MCRPRAGWVLSVLAAAMATASSGAAQTTTDGGQWPFLGGSASHTRSSPLNQINASNFDKLKVAWVFRGDNFGPGLEFTARATPVYVDGVLYTVMGQRRQVVAIDASTGETKWTFREPETSRVLSFSEDGLRQGRGLCECGRARRHLHFHAGLLPVGA